MIDPDNDDFDPKDLDHDSLMKCHHCGAGAYYFEYEKTCVFCGERGHLLEVNPYSYH